MASTSKEPSARPSKKRKANRSKSDVFEEMQTERKKINTEKLKLATDNANSRQANMDIKKEVLQELKRRNTLEEEKVEVFKRTNDILQNLLDKLI